MWRKLILPAFTIILFTTGCSKVKVGDVLTECKKLKDSDDPDAWRKIAAKLKPIYDDKRLKNNADADALRNFYVMSLIRTAAGNGEKLAKAAEIARDVQIAQPKDFLANLQLGEIRQEQGKDDVAYPFLETAHLLKPDNVSALTLLLKAAHKSGVPNADVHFVAAESIPAFKNDPKFYNLWGMWLVKQGDNDLRSRKYYMQAMNKFSAGHRLDKENRELLLNMAILMDEKLHMPKVAKKYYLCFKNTLSDKDREQHVMIQQRLRDLLRQ